MVRTLIIDLWEPNWEIGQMSENGGELLKTKAVFLEQEIKNGVITYIYGFDIRGADIKAAKEEGGAYFEKCVFKDIKNDYSFEGDFIDAFLYINNKMAEYAKKQGDIRRGV